VCGAPVTGPTNLDRYVHAAGFLLSIENGIALAELAHCDSVLDPYIIDGPLLASVFLVRQHILGAPSVCTFCLPNSCPSLKAEGKV